jgi:indolepyruvate decarboxylase
VFGGRGYRVQTVAEMRRMLVDAKVLQGVPALVEVVIPQKDLAAQLRLLAETFPPFAKYSPL